VAEASIKALTKNDAAGEVFNIGTGIATPIEELAKMILEIKGKTGLKIVYSKPRKGDIKHSVADISNARKKLGYSPKISLKDGLKRLLRQA
jgi:UDP-glucose 4-epimerase